MVNFKNQRLNAKKESEFKLSTSDLQYADGLFELPKVESKSDFSDKARDFVDLILIYKGDLKMVEKEFPITSFGIEFIEKAKTICRKKQLLFHEKVLNTIKESIYESKKLNLLQTAVLIFMNDILYLHENGELEEDQYSDIQKYFNELKEYVKKEYGNDEW
ncbi:MAG: hypothetical protein QXW80_03155 [Candidatus Micrarchaeia archaeon]